MAEQITLNVIISTQKNFAVTVDPKSTVAQVKEVIHKEAGIPVEDQRLIYSGHVLANERTVDSYSIKDGFRIHLAVRAKPSNASSTTSSTTTPAPTSAQPQPTTQSTPQTQPQMPQNPFGGMGGMGGFGGMGGMGGFGGMGGMGGLGGMGGMGGLGLSPQQIAGLMSDPAFQQTFQQISQNPQLLQQMLAMNPMAQQLLQSNPQMAAMFQNPEFLQQLTNPEVIQRTMQMMGAFYPQPQQPTGQQQQQQQQQPQQPNPFAGLDFSGLFANQPTTPGTTPVGTTPGSTTSTPAPGTTPNPTGTAPVFPGMGMYPPFPMFNPYMGMGMPGMPGMPGMGQVPVQDPEQRFAVQLQQLNDMGFTNRQVNIQVLTTTHGNVEMAIERLVSGL